jgi:hypothetical protein
MTLDETANILTLQKKRHFKENLQTSTDKRKFDQHFACPFEVGFCVGICANLES